MRYDPVTLDIIWNRLISICDEAETGVMRTAFSLIVRETGDFCCLLLDLSGDSIAQGSLSLIVFLSSAPFTVKKMLEKFPADTLEPGDIIITNNPWLNAGHLYDVCALEPVYHRGKPIALVACVMHWADVGGRSRGGDSRSIYEEGLQLPIIKIAKRGEFNEEVMEIIRENIRFP
ncbi:MAG: hydantoinase B/oxoprolinase family protein, partial [Chloroflexi bacterium]|nr:hydantoinase B/oxoprolinase family protein [Chloroflexota bacterium]